jgi:hypothetical protein
MSDGNVLCLIHKGLNDEDFCQILMGLSNPYRREQRPRKCKRQRRVGQVAKRLFNLPTNVSALNVSDNEGIGDAGMMYLHLIPDTVTNLDLCHCGLTALGIKSLYVFLENEFFHH